MASFTEVKLDLLIDIDMLLMAEKGIRGRICLSIYRYSKSNSKYMKDYEKKNKESSYLQYWNVNNLYVWAMSQKLPLNNFEWTKDTSQFNKDFIKGCNEESDEGYLKLMFNILKHYMNFIMIYHFYQTERKLKSRKACS